MIALKVTLEKKTRSKVTTPHSAHSPPSLDQTWQNWKLHRFQAKSKTCTAKLQRILQNWRECRAPWVKWTLIETKFFSHRYFPGAWTAVFSFDWRASGRDAPHHTFGLKTLSKILRRGNKLPEQNWGRKVALHWDQADQARIVQDRAPPPIPCTPCNILVHNYSWLVRSARSSLCTVVHVLHKWWIR